MTPLNNKLPEKINRLDELAYNLWWSWTPEARSLWKRLDYPLWRKTRHNPVQMLQEIRDTRLQDVARDSAFLRRYTKVMLQFDEMMGNGHSWFHTTYPDLTQNVIAYFSFEFGLHNSLPIYSGGLGILSGDHIKESSDLGLPFVGVGFMYPQGYFRQRIPSHGWQEAVYQQLDMNQAPIQPVEDDQGEAIKISVNIDGRSVHARIWRINVGRNLLYLMDTDVDENEPWDRELSARLYSGDSETRIRQEMMLGLGGVRVLRALGLSPTVWHMNEGHSSFLILECIRELVAQGNSFEEAAALVRSRTVFTTHTPVPAGHDVFSYQLVEKYFQGFWDEMDISREHFLSLGAHDEPWGHAFNMTVLALNMSGQANGVSKLHGRISREMWQEVWPDTPIKEVPIISITNGIHIPTWIASELDDEFNKYLGPNWLENRDDPVLWQRLADMSDKELWLVHLELKRKMMSHLKDLVRRNWVDGRADPTQVLTGGTLLDPETLTIGFARRFATYKRATLIFRDLQRLQQILLDIHRPVQIIFAGKSHPADEPGKALIQEIYNLAKHNRLGGRIAFIEDYNMHMARYLTQGVDVWLNNPIRPREASGTSGMKAALNGVPNLSVLDGWWVEGYNGANGWVVGNDHDFENETARDDFDANSIYQILEDEIVPLYYSRDRDGVPRGWAEVMRESIRSNAPYFSAQRMVKQYTSEMYVKAMNDSA